MTDHDNTAMPGPTPFDATPADLASGDQPGFEPIDHEIRSAFDTAEATLPPMPVDELVQAASRVRDRDVVRRRRRVRATVGTAAALVLVVTGVAVAVTRNAPDTKLVASRNATDEGGGYGPTGRQVVAATVTPASELVDGQRVTITLHGFDPGTPIDALQCTAGSATNPGCDPSSAVEVHAPATTGQSVSVTMAVRAELPQPTPYRVHDVTGLPEPDPLAGVMAPASCVGGEATVTTELPAEPDATGDDSGVPATTMADDGPMVTTPCMILVFGLRDGAPQLATLPIAFTGGDTDPGTEPGSDDSVASPINPVDPGNVDTPSVPPSTWPALCPAGRVPFTFTGDTGPSGPLVDFVPDQLLVCSYDVDGTPDAAGTSTITDPSGTTKLVDALNALTPPPGDQACTDEMGPTVALVATAGARSVTIWVEFYGCGTVHGDGKVRTGGKTLPIPVL